MLQPFYSFILKHRNDVESNFPFKRVCHHIFIGSFYEQFDFSGCHKTLGVSKKGAVSGFYLYHHYGIFIISSDDIDLCFVVDEIAFQNGIALSQEIIYRKLFTNLSKFVVVSQFPDLFYYTNYEILINREDLRSLLLSGLMNSESEILISNKKKLKINCYSLFFHIQLNLPTKY
jgi:hypothetical protein